MQAPFLDIDILPALPYASSINLKIPAVPIYREGNSLTVHFHGKD